jgi:hypothetical protein
VVATGGKPWQMPQARTGQKQAKTVAVGCDQLPRRAHGKEGVDGSSPSEGSRKGPQTRGVHFVSPLHLFQRDRVWNTFWNTQTKNDAVPSSFLTTNERPPTWVKTGSTVRVVTEEAAPLGRGTKA